MGPDDAPPPRPLDAGNGAGGHDDAGIEIGVGHEWGVFVNRTLNLNSVEAVGYDMDYTLIPYRTEEWELAAFEHAAAVLAGWGWDTAGMRFEPDDHIQGLVFDLELGNVVKATRFGYVVRGHHGTRPLTFDELRQAYAEVMVDLGDPRFRFMNTLFSISEASLYAQLVDRLDAGEARIDGGSAGPMGYDELHKVVSAALDQSHTTGALKAAIVADPDRFCALDDDTAGTLLDQRLAGKRLLLITNSEWGYTQPMMSWCFDRAVAAEQAGATWRDLFDVVIVAAAKPGFFSGDAPVFRVVDPVRGLLAPDPGPIRSGEVYHGGSAGLVERSLGLAGRQILYVGDHLFGDVHVSKQVLRWRTALIIREIEAEIAAARGFADGEERLRELMAAKVTLEDELSTLRVDALRNGSSSGSAQNRLRALLADLDQQIAPLASRAGDLGNPVWGPLMRSGIDKSLFARQVERYADVYTSRVSNLRTRTPFAYLRAGRTTLPHDVV